MKLDFDDHGDDNCEDELLHPDPDESPVKDAARVLAWVVLLFGTLAGFALLCQWLGGPLK